MSIEIQAVDELYEVIIADLLEYLECHGDDIYETYRGFYLSDEVYRYIDDELEADFESTIIDDLFDQVVQKIKRRLKENPDHG